MLAFTHSSRTNSIISDLFYVVHLGSLLNPELFTVCPKIMWLFSVYKWFQSLLHCLSLYQPPSDKGLDINVTRWGLPATVCLSFWYIHKPFHVDPAFASYPLCFAESDHVRRKKVDSVGKAPVVLYTSAAQRSFASWQLWISVSATYQCARKI
jgi:hypothetical protein